LRGNGFRVALRVANINSHQRSWDLGTSFSERLRPLPATTKFVCQATSAARRDCEALRVYYPRFSYLNHLPARSIGKTPNPRPSSSRFLANVEGTYTAIEDRIAAVQMLFDTRAAPSEALDWLASWFGVVFDPGLG